MEGDVDLSLIGQVGWMEGGQRGFVYPHVEMLGNAVSVHLEAVMTAEIKDMKRDWPLRTPRALIQSSRWLKDRKIGR
jgi:hypothetical protein